MCIAESPRAVVHHQAVAIFHACKDRLVSLTFLHLHYEVEVELVLVVYTVRCSTTMLVYAKAAAVSSLHSKPPSAVLRRVTRTTYQE